MHEINLPPQILARGFWLYAWKIEGPNGENFCYVGMTGDTTGVAQSAFNRASAHFGFNENSNQIRKNLGLRGFQPEECGGIKFFVFGPIFPYVHSKPSAPDFEACRLRTASLENALWHLFCRHGYNMLNREPNKGSGLDKAIWNDVRQAFSKYI